MLVALVSQLFISCNLSLMMYFFDRFVLHCFLGSHDPSGFLGSLGSTGSLVFLWLLVPLDTVGFLGSHGFLCSCGSFGSLGFP